MTALSYQFGNMNDTVLPVGIRVSRAPASVWAWWCSAAQSKRMSLSTNIVRRGVSDAAVPTASASVVCTHNPRRYASAACAVLARAITLAGLTIHATHRHRVPEPRRQVGVDGHLGHLTIGGRVGAPHLQ